MIPLFQTEQQFTLEYLIQQIVYITINNYLLFVYAPPCFSVYRLSSEGSFTEV
jgi:hypothetical protein